MLVILEWILVLVIAIAVGANVSGLTRAPRHLQFLLQDVDELARVMRFLGPMKLREEAARIDPAVGFGKNLDIWEQAHAISLRRPRNVLLVVALLDLLGAYFLSRSCLLVVLAFFVVPWLFPVADTVKNNNVLHLHTVILNLVKWHGVDAAGCEVYCMRERPELAVLHSIVIAMPET